jgi:pilus assembly protein CpaF
VNVGRMAPTDAYGELRNLALDEVQRLGLDPSDRDEVRRLLQRLIDDYQTRATSGGGRRPLADRRAMLHRLERSLLEYGPLTGFLDGSLDYEELLIHGDEVTYVDRDGRLVVHDEPVSADEVVHVVNKLLATVGASVDERHPILQAQVLDGTGRLGVVIPPVADRIDVTLRRYLTRRETLDELIGWDALSPAAADLLTVMLRTPTGVLVTGQPGSGKTTLANALLRAAPPNMRVIACEDTPELSVAHLHGARWRTRPAGPDGTGAVTLRDLVRVALGMRPDLIVVGETRGEEAYELTRAGNAGCGLVSTIHANNARQGLNALVSTAVMAGPNVAPDQVRSVFASVVDLVVHTARQPEAASERRMTRRQVMEIVAIPPLQGREHDFTVEPIFQREDFGQPLRWTGSPLPADLEARLDRVLRVHGLRAADLLDGSGRLP